MRNKAPPRLLTVLRTRRITPNMQRITFGGDGLLGFPVQQEGANVKLLLPHNGQSWPDYLASLAGQGVKPLKRTYTILDYREHCNELDVEFALHSAGSNDAVSARQAEVGPATAWAVAAQPGDQMAIAGPGRLSCIDPLAAWFLLAGDMSALPAIKSNINRLPANAKGSVFVEITDLNDQQDFSLPAGMNLRWIVNSPAETAVSGKNEQPMQRLIDACRSMDWLAGVPSIWIAGESNGVRTLRSWLAQEKQVDASLRYTSGYWQLGETEDSFQVFKRQIDLLT